MSDPINGTDILILLNTGTVGSPVWTAHAHQRDASLDETNEYIDTSSKASRKRTGLAGRYSASYSLDGLHIYDDAAEIVIQDAVRDGDLVQVMRSRDGGNVEWAYAVITSFTRNYPDQDASTYSATFEVSGDWTPA